MDFSLVLSFSRPTTSKISYSRLQRREFGRLKLNSMRSRRTVAVAGMRIYILNIIYNIYIIFIRNENDNVVVLRRGEPYIQNPAALDADPDYYQDTVTKLYFLA